MCVETTSQIWLLKIEHAHSYWSLFPRNASTDRTPRALLSGILYLSVVFPAMGPFAVAIAIGTLVLLGILIGKTSLRQ